MLLVVNINLVTKYLLMYDPLLSVRFFKNTFIQQFYYIYMHTMNLENDHENTYVSANIINRLE
jgi:hypothetical protein